MKAAPVLILLALAWAAAGCGQKGPLVLPDAEHPRKKLKFPATPKSGAPAQPTEPKAPAGPPTAPRDPTGPSQDSAPPAAAPESDPTPDATPPA